MVCSYCETPGKPVTAHCLDCKESMCETCHLSHRKIKALQDHQVVPIEDVESGKAKMSEKKYCTKHEGETNKFYCETCEKLVCRDCIVMKQCCRDHDYIALQEAAEKQAGNVKKALEVCKEVEMKILSSITKCEKVENDIKTECERVENKIKADREYIESKLQEKKDKLQQSLVEVKNAYKMGSELHQSSSSCFDSVLKYAEIVQTLDSVAVGNRANHAEIISKYDDEIKQTLDKEGSYSIPTEDALKGLRYPMLPSSSGLGLKNQWKQVGQFHTENTKFTITSNNNIAFCALTSTYDCDIYDDIYEYFIKVTSRSGATKQTLKVPEVYDTITSTNDGMYVVSSTNKKSIITYDANGQETSSFPTTDMNNKPSAPQCVTVDNAGNIIVGSESGTVSIHSKDGSIINQFKAGSQTYMYPIGIAAVGKDRIAVIFKNTAPFLRIFDYSGNIIRNSPPPPEVMVCSPVSICSSNKGELFVLNKGKTDDVYMYTGEGVYVGCVTTEIDKAIEIAVSPDNQELFVVTNTGSGPYPNYATIFQRPY